MPVKILSGCVRPAQPNINRPSTNVPDVKTSRVLPYSAQQMYDLVLDVEAYPAFVPACSHLVVLERAANQRPMLARMTVAYKALQASYTSRIVADDQALTLHVEAVDGPFKKLINQWRFEPVNDSTCRVHFALEYTFRNPIFGAAMSVLFDKVFGRFIEAFEKRAQHVYPR